ncbi:MAG: hypothetical protein WCR45_06105 [Bacteroidaceae bacterium]|nr:hypothetical protein [Bacteroidaceae bacterium]
MKRPKNKNIFKTKKTIKYTPSNYARSTENHLGAIHIIDTTILYWMQSRQSKQFG